jgi:hypothetical protein
MKKASLMPAQKKWSKGKGTASAVSEPSRVTLPEPSIHNPPGSESGCS